MGKQTHVLLLSKNDARRTHWAEVLEAVDHLHVLATLESPTGSIVPEVVVTDQLPLAAAAESLARYLVRGEIGVVAVGERGPADIILPVNHSSRELLLAVRLLSQIVQLRRQRRCDEKTRAALRRLAMSDPLTGLPNRRAWERQLPSWFDHETQGRCSSCLVLVDIDHFKWINDQHGHMTGDRVLRAVANRLIESMRAGDIVARLGGDEFSLLLTEVGHEESSNVVERIRCCVGRIVLSDMPSLSVTASAGYVVMESDVPMAFEQAFHAADLALRQAKASGRDRSVAAQPAAGDQ